MRVNRWALTSMKLREIEKRCSNLGRGYKLGDRMGGGADFPLATVLDISFDIVTILFVDNESLSHILLCRDQT